MLFHSNCLEKSFRNSSNGNGEGNVVVRRIAGTERPRWNCRRRNARAARRERCRARLRLILAGMWCAKKEKKKTKEKQTLLCERRARATSTTGADLRAVLLIVKSARAAVRPLPPRASVSSPPAHSTPSRALGAVSSTADRASRRPTRGRSFCAPVYIDPLPRVSRGSAAGVSFLAVGLA